MSSTHYELPDGTCACGADSRRSRRRCSAGGDQLRRSTAAFQVDCSRCQRTEAYQRHAPVRPVEFVPIVGGTYESPMGNVYTVRALDPRTHDARVEFGDSSRGSLPYTTIKGHMRIR
jgi:hypothetical protein